MSMTNLQWIPTIKTCRICNINVAERDGAGCTGCIDAAIARSRRANDAHMALVAAHGYEHGAEQVILTSHIVRLGAEREMYAACGESQETLQQLDWQIEDAQVALRRLER